MKPFVLDQNLYLSFKNLIKNKCKIVDIGSMVGSSSLTLVSSFPGLIEEVVMIESDPIFLQEAKVHSERYLNTKFTFYKGVISPIEGKENYYLSNKNKYNIDYNIVGFSESTTNHIILKVDSYHFDSLIKDYYDIILMDVQNGYHKVIETMKPYLNKYSNKLPIISIKIQPKKNDLFWEENKASLLFLRSISYNIPDSIIEGRFDPSIYHTLVPTNYE